MTSKIEIPRNADPRRTEHTREVVLGHKTAMKKNTFKSVAGWC